MTDSIRNARGAPRSPEGLRVLVIGLGRFGGGVGVTRWLADQGARVSVTDRAGPDALRESIAALSDIDVEYHLGGHDPRNLDACDLVVVNPAVSKTHSRLFQQIVRRGLPWTTEINVFCERCPAEVIGVTGSYGKSTTSAMLADALEAYRSAGDLRHTDVRLGGNIGGSLLTELPAIRPSDLIVLELSSAQLEDLPRIAWSPTTAVITNLSSHHLDRYGTYAAYLEAKFNIVRAQQVTDRIIVGDIDSEAESTLSRALADRWPCVTRVVRPDPQVELCIPGEHNRANAACVLTVCRTFGLNDRVARMALREFKGLPHRLQHVRSLAGVDYYDDSKSTSPAATRKAIEAFDRPTVVIVGGQDRQVCLDACVEALVESCRAVIGVGESGARFVRAVRTRKGAARHDTALRIEDLEQAVRVARDHAQAGDVILFSPGAPSFDAYYNFAERGRHFVEIVGALR